MAVDIKQDLIITNEIGKSESNRSEFLDRLTQLIELNSQAKQLSLILISLPSEFSEVFNFSLLKSDLFVSFQPYTNS